MSVMLPMELTVEHLVRVAALLVEDMMVIQEKPQYLIVRVRFWEHVQDIMRQQPLVALAELG